MQLKSITRYRYFYLILLLLLTSCEELFDKNLTYTYRVKNNTSKLVEVHLTSRTLGNKDVLITKIEAGATQGVWTTTDYNDEGWVYNREKHRKEFLEFKILAISKEGAFLKSNPNETKPWVYEKKNSKNATYILALEETDF
ncbi:MAG: hypothetical protein ACO1OF_17540 [Adhaeribacter sp.]